MGAKHGSGASNKKPTSMAEEPAPQLRQQKQMPHLGRLDHRAGQPPATVCSRQDHRVHGRRTARQLAQSLAHLAHQLGASAAKRTSEPCPSRHVRRSNPRTRCTRIGRTELFGWLGSTTILKTPRFSTSAQSGSERHWIAVQSCGRTCGGQSCKRSSSTISHSTGTRLRKLWREEGESRLRQGSAAGRWGAASQSCASCASAQVTAACRYRAKESCHGKAKRIHGGVPQSRRLQTQRAKRKPKTESQTLGRRTFVRTQRLRMSTRGKKIGRLGGPRHRNRNAMRPAGARRRTPQDCGRSTSSRGRN